MSANPAAELGVVHDIEGPAPELGPVLLSEVLGLNDTRPSAVRRRWSPRRRRRRTARRR